MRSMGRVCADYEEKLLLKQEAAELLYDALKALLHQYVELAESGDCGLFWNPYEEAPVKAALWALGTAEGPPK